MGFPKNNHYSRAFSYAIQKAINNGTMAKLEKEFNISSDEFPCHETFESSTDAVLVDMVAGVFLVSGLFILGGTVQGVLCGETRCLVRYLRVVFCVTCCWKPSQTCCFAATIFATSQTHKPVQVGC